MQDLHLFFSISLVEIVDIFEKTFLFSTQYLLISFYSFNSFQTFGTLTHATELLRFVLYHTYYIIPDKYCVQKFGFQTQTNTIQWYYLYVWRTKTIAVWGFSMCIIGVYRSAMFQKLCFYLTHLDGIFTFWMYELLEVHA